MIARELWQHRASGEVYAVQLDEQSQVTAAAGPLQSDEHQATIAGEFDGRPGLAEEINESREQYELHVCTDHAS
jgi:hypothetical protein